MMGHVFCFLRLDLPDKNVTLHLASPEVNNAIHQLPMMRLLPFFSFTTSWCQYLSSFSKATSLLNCCYLFI